jgi:hypothetical protein
MIALVLAASIVPMAPAIATPGGARFEPSGAVARAEVRVRIISGASIMLGRSANDGAARLRSTSLTIDGEQRDARLVEFP